MRSIMISIIEITLFFPFNSVSSSDTEKFEEESVHSLAGGSSMGLSGQLKHLSVRRKSLSASSTDSPSPLESVDGEKDKMVGEVVGKKDQTKEIENYQKMVLDYLDGKFEGTISPISSIKESNVVNVVGEGLMAEFYRLLGHQHSEEGNFSEAAQAYYEVFHLPVEPEYHFSKFLAEIGISKRSTPEEIEKILRG